MSMPELLLLSNAVMWCLALQFYYLDYYYYGNSIQLWYYYGIIIIMVIQELIVISRRLPVLQVMETSVCNVALL